MPRMRIGLNALLCSSGRNYRRTGVSRYIDELVRHLARPDSADELIAYVSRRLEPEGWDGVRLPASARPSRKAADPNRLGIRGIADSPPVATGWISFTGPSTPFLPESGCRRQ